MAGVDRNTLQPQANFPNAVQALGVILSTRLYSRVMRRGFGGGVAELLGRAMTPELMGLFRQMLATSINLWEPRFRVRRVTFEGSVDGVRLGQATLRIDVDWRPRALQNDFRVEGSRSFRLLSNAQVEVLTP